MLRNLLREVPLGLAAGKWELEGWKGLFKNTKRRQNSPPSSQTYLILTFESLQTWEATTQIQDTTLRIFLWSGSNSGRKISTTHLEFQENQKKKNDATKAHSYQATLFHVGDQTDFIFPFSRPESLGSFN